MNKFPLKQRTRITDNETIMNFQTLLTPTPSYQQPPPQKKTPPRESLHIDTDPNHIFNSLLCTSLNVFQAGFAVKYKCMKNKNEWITPEITIILQTQKKYVCLH